MLIPRYNYSINESGAAWGVRHDVKSTANSLKALFELIDFNAASPFEVTTHGPSGNSLLRVTGRLKKITNNGHLVLNPHGVDLRIAPGTVIKVTLEKVAAEGYRAAFFNRDDKIVLQVNFVAKKELQTGIYDIHSFQGRLKPIDLSKGIAHAWRSLRDIHHFYPMLTQFGLSKLEAFNQVPSDLAYQVDTSSVWQVLSAIALSRDNFMIFTGNGAVFHVYTGPVNKLLTLNNCGQTRLVVHGQTGELETAIFKITTSKLSQAWVVNKFSAQGPITSLELFDDQQNHVAQFNSHRLEGMAQDEKWTRLMKSLPKIV
ncbi:ChuX/HutX family heme-like substrate-binding protein [Enterobacter sp. Bisph1]|uniref:ChuX/HutX family heme-like substrate-binding protein n=1 Tax=Enterobacter sp. Bisph1 TaxID=1274399 RepID=UPI00057C1D8C|nr:ChuX/HutX family heme-like substrate-binding protein [Enterobacter sp. Bisph1]